MYSLVVVFIGQWQWFLSAPKGDKGGVIRLRYPAKKWTLCKSYY